MSDDPEAPPGRGASTRAVHGRDTRPKPGFSVTAPIVLSSTFTFPRTSDLVEFMEGRASRGPEYGRYGNPTEAALEARLAALDGGEAALLFSSGMAAVTTTLLAMLRKDAHVVFTDDCYRKTRQFAGELLRRYGVEFDLVPPRVEAVERALRPRTTLVFTESPTNPYLSVVDLEALAVLGKARGVKTVVDSTFATPHNQRPLEAGIDLVIHSATKYLGGHNDLLAGCVVGRSGLVSAIRDVRGILGPVADPVTAYLLGRGLKTLALRMERHNRSGQAVAEFLAGHPKVTRVHYPGLPSHPDHTVARRQMSGFGGVVSFEVEGGLEAGTRLVDAVRIPQIAPSLGGVESLIEQPALMSFYELSPEEREAIGIRAGLVRLSVGIEDAEDLIEDLSQALERV